MPIKQRRDFDDLLSSCLIPCPSLPVGFRQTTTVTAVESLLAARGWLYVKEKVWGDQFSILELAAVH